jgi:hypothetical protein
LVKNNTKKILPSMLEIHVKLHRTVPPIQNNFNAQKKDEKAYSVQ